MLLERSVSEWGVTGPALVPRQSVEELARTVFVENLDAHAVAKDALASYFSTCGTVVHVALADADDATRCAFIQFHDAESAARATSRSGTVYCRRVITFASVLSPSFCIVFFSTHSTHVHVCAFAIVHSFPLLLQSHNGTSASSSLIARVIVAGTRPCAPGASARGAHAPLPQGDHRGLDGRGPWTPRTPSQSQSQSSQSALAPSPQPQPQPQSQPG